MTAPTDPRPASGLPIAAVERETGLGKDTLRVWERRYGFPQPLRDANGDRLYPAGQVQRLKLIRQLMDAGLRPGKVVSLDDAALHALLSAQPATAAAVLSRTRKPPTLDTNLSVEQLLDTIGAHDPVALRHALNHAQLRLGLAPFVTDLVAPLTVAVGEAWAQGRFEVFEEHLFTEVLTGVLRHAIVTLAPMPMASGPKVLLTTLPLELHGLGLLMVEALLTLEGCACVSLGTQTPPGDVVQAALAHRADVVALSFSDVHEAQGVLNGLRELRSLLPATTALWAGGGCSALYAQPLAGVTTLQQLSGLPALVQQWRQTHGSF